MLGYLIEEPLNQRREVGEVWRDREKGGGAELRQSRLRGFPFTYGEKRKPRASVRRTSESPELWRGPRLTSPKLGESPEPRALEDLTAERTRAARRGVIIRCRGTWSRNARTEMANRNGEV